MLPGVPVRDYVVSRDGKDVAFTAIAAGGTSQIWLGPLDRHSSPRQIASGDSVSFGAAGELIFRAIEAKANYLTRIRPDGSGRERVTETPIFNKYGVSPNGQWAIVVSAAAGENAAAETVAVPVHGGVPRKLCRDCWGEWSADGRLLYLATIGSTSMASVRTLAFPVAPGASFPAFPPSGVILSAGAAGLPGAVAIDGAPAGMSPGSSVSAYVFVKTDLQRNLFKIPLH